MTRIIRVLIMAAVLAVMSSVIASSALADNTPVSLSNVTYSYDQTTVVGNEMSVANGGTNGRQQVRFTMPHGLTKPMKQKATTCLVAANDTRPARAGEKCGHIKIGTSITNSGTLRSTNRFGMFADTVHQGDTFYLIDGQWRKGKCGNKVWFKFSQPRPKGPVLPNWKVQVVQYFTTTATVKLTLNKSVHASASASCALSGSAASATASANGSGYAQAIGQATARSSAQARSSALHSATQNIATQEETLKANAKADVYVKLQANASAVVSCTSTPTSPPPVVCQPPNTIVNGVCTAPPPPVVQPPSLSNQVNPEEIDASGEAYPNICVTVSAKNGDSITVIFGATYGHFTASTATITSSGVDRVCTTYVGPTDSTAVGKQEVITYDAHDNTSGLNAQQVKSVPFPIKAPPAQV